MSAKLLVLKTQNTKFKIGWCFLPFINVELYHLTFKFQLPKFAITFDFSGKSQLIQLTASKVEKF